MILFLEEYRSNNSSQNIHVVVPSQRSDKIYVFWAYISLSWRFQFAATKISEEDKHLL